MKTVTTLSDDEIKIAVVRYFDDAAGRTITCDQVSLSTETKMVGRGMNENTIHVVKIQVIEESDQ